MPDILPVCLQDQLRYCKPEVRKHKGKQVIAKCRQTGGIFYGGYFMIHQYKLGGFNIVLDVCSGSVHVVDEVAYDIIAEFENKEKDVIVAQMLQKYASDDVTEEDVLECYSQVEELKANGKLFAPDTFEPMANKLKEKTAGVVKALCLHIAHTCNLNCSYCFASQDLRRISLRDARQKHLPCRHQRLPWWSGRRGRHGGCHHRQGQPQWQAE